MEQSLCIIKAGLSLHIAEHLYLFIMNRDQNIDLCNLRVDHRGSEHAVVCDADDTQHRLGDKYYDKITYFRTIGDAYVIGYSDGYMDGESGGRK
jgi:hypothetical protein